ncbi:MAG: rod shape-determining protein MreC, partial [Verrucomicrobiota bacterium]
AAMVAETRDHGVIKGAQSTLEAGVVEWTALRHSPEVMAGHRLLTSGLGGVFPKGLTVGQVIDTREVDAGLYTVARVRLAANLGRLEEVWVLQP